jgi:two-component system response regulator AtoC
MWRVLLLEPNETLRQTLSLGLRSHDIPVEAVSTVAEAAVALGSDPPDIVIVGPGCGTADDPLDVIVSHGRRADSPTPRAPVDVVMLVGGESQAEFQHGLRAIRRGAADFVSLGDNAAALAMALRKIEARRAALAGPVEPLRSPSPSRHAPVLVGASPQIAAVLNLIRRLSGVRASVLIGGESGTGKELVAQALHDQSPWRAGPFVAVNCGAIPAGLIESELFGHVRGSFTDAVRDKRGLFQAAHGGTLFLDEIADLPLELQSKLLRAVQEGVIRRVGDVDDVRVEVRVVAATARELSMEVAARRFREDLYYRLAGLTIHLPPLRERRQDIPLLAAHFLASARRRMALAVHGIDEDAQRLLAAYPWPGNVRELENTIERAAVLCAGDRIDVASLPERMIPSGFGGATGGEWSAQQPAPAPAAQEDSGSLSIKQAARRSEEDLIRRALAATGGNRTRAAALLEISHRALLYKIKEYGIAIASGAGTGPGPGPGASANVIPADDG